MFFILLSSFFIKLCLTDISENNIQRAQINISYLALNGDYILEHSIGWYGVESKIGNANGRLVLSLSIDNKTDGCSRIMNIVHEPWIALIKRNSCKFQDKIYNAAILNNASAVIIYNSENSTGVVAMKHQMKDVVAIFVSFSFGQLYAKLLLNNTLIHISIMPEDFAIWDTWTEHRWLTSRTSVLFVSISFIVLIAVSLCWLAIYYVQRFRYVSSKHVSKRLMNAAWRAVQSMEQKSIRNGDAELNGDTNVCAICVENYKVAETIRILPCKHRFHKSCVDTWLLEQRRCPMCQLDILQHPQVNKKKKSFPSSNCRANQSPDISRLPLVANPTTVETTCSSLWPINVGETKTVYSYWSKISNLEDSDSMDEDDWTENLNNEVKQNNPVMAVPNIKERAKITKSDWLSGDKDKQAINDKINVSTRSQGNNIRLNNIGNNAYGWNRTKKRCSSESGCDYSPTCSSVNSKRKLSDFSATSEF